jgi:hypothetical protein
MRLKSGLGISLADSSSNLNGLTLNLPRRVLEWGRWHLVQTPGACVAVGSSYAAGVTKTLAEAYTG